MDVDRFEEVHCRRLHVVDENDISRIRLSYDDGSDNGVEAASVQVCDSGGRPRIRLTVGESDVQGVGTHVTLLDHKGRTRFSLFFADNYADDLGVAIGTFDEDGEHAPPSLQKQLVY